MFLTDEQLRELTGRQRPAAQIRWLRANGLRHWVRADGHPVVPVSAVEGREQAAPVRSQPNFAALRRTG